MTNDGRGGSPAGEPEDALTEAVENLIFAAEELRDHAVSAADFWDEYVGPGEKDHPSDQCFRNLRDPSEINSAITDVRAASPWALRCLVGSPPLRER